MHTLMSYHLARHLATAFQKGVPPGDSLSAVAAVVGGDKVAERRIAAQIAVGVEMSDGRTERTEVDGTLLRSLNISPTLEK